MNAGTMKCSSVSNKQILQQGLWLWNHTVHLSWSLHSESCGKETILILVPYLLESYAMT